VTQHLVGWLYEQTGPDGSRWSASSSPPGTGGELALWAVFERAGRAPSCDQLHDRTYPGAQPARSRAHSSLQLHRLTWTG